MRNVFKELNGNQTITVSWDEHLENIVSIQHLYCKETPFRSKIMRYNDLDKQTRSFFVRIEIKMLAILRMLFAYVHVA